MRTQVKVITVIISSMLITTFALACTVAKVCWVCQGGYPSTIYKCSDTDPSDGVRACVKDEDLQGKPISCEDSNDCG